MSKHKAAGKTKQHTSPAGKRLGLKVSDGQKVGTGAILIRQSGTKFNPGNGVKLGRDHTLFAVSPGVVKFGQRLGKKTVSIA
jgi:large subunit ribosomal protein L27